MQMTRRSFRDLRGFQISLLTLCGLFIATAFGPTFASTNKAKADQPRTQTKTQAKGLASRPTPRVAEVEHKGKKGAASAKESVQLGKKLGKSEPVAVARKPHEQSSKLKASTRSERAIEKPTLVKASAKLTDKKLPAKTTIPNKGARLAEQPLTSRLTRATFAPVTPLKPQAESERRGKFGKAESDGVRSDDRRANHEEEKAALSTRPTRRREAANSRETERNLERDEATPAVRPREVNTATDTPAYQIQLPDKIEVVEYGSTSPTMTKLLTLPEARPLTPFGAVVTKTNTPPSKRNDLAIPPQRVLEIQYELVKRGFYSAEPNGLYDEATILAMWEFQKNYGLPATGYPSAHSLKRLGLTGW